MRSDRRLAVLTATTFLIGCAVVAVSGCRTEPAMGAQVTEAGGHWVDPSTLRPGPRQAKPLTDDQVARITAVQQTFQDVDPDSLQDWLDDFQRDRDPEREIRVYEGMAAAYHAFCDGRSIPPEGKRDVYQIVLLRSEASDEEVLSRMRLKVLSAAEAEEVLRGYTAPPRPLIVAGTPPPVPSPQLKT